MKNFEITCPCCESLIVVDRLSGEVLLHKAKASGPVASLETMFSKLETQRADAARRLDQGIESQKDRGRILEEKFREALERADKSDKPMPNALDLE